MVDDKTECISKFSGRRFVSWLWNRETTFLKTDKAYVGVGNLALFGNVSGSLFGSSYIFFFITNSSISAEGHFFVMIQNKMRSIDCFSIWCEITIAYLIGIIVKKYRLTDEMFSES